MLSGGKMLQGFSRRCWRGAGVVPVVEIIWIAIFVLVITRTSPPQFLRSSFQSVASSLFDHEHRQYFDHQDSSRASLPSTTRLNPPPLWSPRLPSRSARVVNFLAVSFHYGRPPPVD